MFGLKWANPVYVRNDYCFYPVRQLYRLPREKVLNLSAARKKIANLLTSKKFLVQLALAAVFLTILIVPAQAQAPAPAGGGGGTIFPSVNIGVGQSQNPEDISITLQLLFLMTILSLAPSILIMMTSFTRIVVVFHFLRQALGTQGMPSNQLLVGLALFLTFYIMGPVWKEINDKALQPYLRHEITQAQGFDRALLPMRTFMFNQVREKDLKLFVFMSKIDKPDNTNAIPTLVLVPAFIVSELRTAFTIGFLIYLPFIMIDMIVSSVLLSMGMMMFAADYNFRCRSRYCSL